MARNEKWNRGLDILVFSWGAVSNKELSEKVGISLRTAQRMRKFCVDNMTVGQKLAFGAFKYYNKEKLVRWPRF